MENVKEQTLVESLLGAIGVSQEEAKELKKIFENSGFSLDKGKVADQKSTYSAPSTNYAPSNYNGMGSVSALNPGMNAYGSQAAQMHMRGGPTSFQNIAQAGSMSELADASLMRYRAMSPQQGMSKGQSNNSPAFTDNTFSQENIDKAFGKTSSSAPAFNDDMFSPENIAKVKYNEDEDSSKKTVEASSPSPNFTPATPFDSFLASVSKMMPGGGDGNAIKEMLKKMGVDFNGSTTNILSSITKSIGLSGFKTVDDFVKDLGSQIDNAYEEKKAPEVAVVTPEVASPKIETSTQVEESLKNAQEMNTKPLSIERTSEKVDAMLAEDSKDVQKKNNEFYRFSIY